MNPRAIFAELKRRNVYKVAVAYAVIAWLLIQVSDTVFPRLNLPDWAVTLVIVLVLLGFPVALVLAWAFELTPEGVVRADDVATNKSITRKTGRKLTVVIVLVGAVAAAMFAFQFVRPKASVMMQGERAAVPDKSIAVLPFENASGNPDTEYLSDGISEALINSLTELQQLKVTARSTAFRYRGKAIDPQVVGSELKVRTVLMGLVRQVGERIDVQVDLVDAATGTQLWGTEYQRPASELLSVKQTIAREVTEKLRLRLSGEEQQQLTRRDTTNAEAYRFYLRGRHHWNKRTAEELKKAIAEFEQAAEQDPNYALAFVGLADSYVLLAGYDAIPAGEALAKARAAADRALQIDDSLAEAHTSSGAIYRQERRWREADPEFKRALALNPNYPTAHHWYGIHLLEQGQLKEGLAESQRAYELDPLSLVINTHLAAAYLANGDAQAALEQSRKAIELDPNYASGHIRMGLAYARQGKAAEAQAAVQKALSLSKASWVMSEAANVYARTGKRDEANDLIKKLEDLYANQQARGSHLAAVYAGLGDNDQAFAWLEKDFNGSTGAFVAWYPTFEPLRSDPRFAVLLRRMGL